MICFSCYHFATQLGSTHENRAVRDWTTPRINPTRLPMYFSPRYGRKPEAGAGVNYWRWDGAACTGTFARRSEGEYGLRLDTVDDAALHVRCWPFCDVLIPPNGRFALPAQPVATAQALNLSAGVSNCKVSRGRSF